MELKMGIGHENKRKYETINDRIIFYRFLGHNEIQNGHQWRMDTRCWICEKWKYTCVIANRATIGQSFQDTNEFDPTPYHNKIVKNNITDSSGMLVFNNSPKITGSFSQWKS